MPSATGSLGQRRRIISKTIKISFLWLIILVLAFFNGGLREVVLIPSLGNPFALIISGLLLSTCILIVAYIFIPKLGTLKNIEYFFIGLYWLGLTLIFEFTFGLLIQHKTLEVMLEVYKFKDGNIWTIVLFVILIAPLIATKIQKNKYHINE